MSELWEDSVMEEEPEQEGAWMTTFADLMSLLLTFFVLMLSFAQMDIIKFRDAMGSLKDAFGYVDSTDGPYATKSTTLIDFTYIKKETNVELPVEVKFKKEDKKAVKVTVSSNEEILSRVEESIVWNGLEDMVAADNSAQGVIVRVKGELLFAPGTDMLKSEALPLLDDIISIIEEFHYKVNLEGHTDNLPISTVRFPSNWELSTDAPSRC